MEPKYLEQEMITEDRYRRLFECLRNDTSEQLHKGWHLNPLGFKITEIKVICKQDITMREGSDIWVKFYYESKIACSLYMNHKIYIRPGELLEFNIPGLINPLDKSTLFDNISIEFTNEHDVYRVSFVRKNFLREKIILDERYIFCGDHRSYSYIESSLDHYVSFEAGPYINFMIYPTLFYKNKCLNGLGFQNIVKLVGGRVRNINKSYTLKEWDEISNFSFCLDKNRGAKS